MFQKVDPLNWNLIDAELRNLRNYPVVILKPPYRDVDFVAENPYAVVVIDIVSGV